MSETASHVVIIGAGIGGLATALRLAHRGVRVTVLERHAGPGGKMRTLPTAAGPVDAGPTVLTMKPVFEALFRDVGLRIEDHVTLASEEIQARHFWPDGTTLDLMQDHDQSYANVAEVFGANAAKEFKDFATRTRFLFDTFDGPMIRSERPLQSDLALTVLKNPKILPAMDPLRSLAKSLAHQFSDPRLAQLFARYATYVGGLPALSPSLLSLIWQAENQGVWHVKGGMHELAKSLESAARSFGATFIYDAHVTRVETQDGRASAVQTANARIEADAVLFNGDPNALREGYLGPSAKYSVPETAVTPRSLSANVMSFAAIAEGVPLAAHNVFFADDPEREYAPLAKSQQQVDPTLYICAQDRFGGAIPSGEERFEIILNSPPFDDNGPETPQSDDEEREQCQTLILERLNRFSLTFSPRPAAKTLTMTRDFDQMFPASKGSLYGRSPHGIMAAFKRPTARTALKGLYLAGGGAHPGAGVPMATLSGKHAAEAILKDLRLT